MKRVTSLGRKDQRISEAFLFIWLNSLLLQEMLLQNRLYRSKFLKFQYIVRFELLLQMIFSIFRIEINESNQFLYSFWTLLYFFILPCCISLLSTCHIVRKNKQKLIQSSDCCFEKLQTTWSHSDDFLVILLKKKNVT